MPSIKIKGPEVMNIEYNITDVELFTFIFRTLENNIINIIITPNINTE
jgi:DNA helicase TIP49 (TBP-interacting protein)